MHNLTVKTRKEGKIADNTMAGLGKAVYAQSDPHWHLLCIGPLCYRIVEVFKKGHCTMIAH